MRCVVPFIAFLAVFAGEAFARDIAVGDAVALDQAIGATKSGDRIVLAPGRYGDLVIKGRRFTAPVEIAAAPGARAEFRSVRLEDAAGLKFSAVVVARGVVEDPISTYAVLVARSAEISFDGVEVLGSADGRPNDPQGIVARDSRSVRVSNARLHDLVRGAGFLDCDDWSVVNSEFTAISMDALVARGAVGALIEGNYFHDFTTDLSTGVHPDAIQFWDRRAKRPTRNLVIRRNAIVRGAGGPSQGVFLNFENPALGGETILIEDNLIVQSMGEGIDVRTANDVVIRRNTVIPADPARDRPLIGLRAPVAGAVIEDNVALGYRPGGAAMRGNIVLDYLNPHAEGYAERLFADPRGGEEAGYFALGPAGARGVAPKFIAPPAAAIIGQAAPRDPQRFAFRIDGVDGAVGWRVKAPRSDAFIAGGAAPGFEFDFAAPGLAVVEASWRDGGVLKNARKTFRVPPRVLLSSDFSALPKPDGAPNGGYLQLSPEAGWTGMTALDVAVEAAPGPRAEKLGTIIQAPRAWSITMSATRISATLLAANGARAQLNAALPDAERATSRKIRLIYDGEVGRARLMADGVSIAESRAASGPLGYWANAPLYVGGAPWGEIFSGSIGRVEVSRAIDPGEGS